MQTRNYLLAALALSSGIANAQTPVWRLNAGGPAITAGGASFQADQAYNSMTGAGFVGSTSEVLLTGSATSTGWLDAPFRNVNWTGRSGFDAYRFDVAPGEYIVRMHFAEVRLMNQGPGLRSISLDMEGTPAVVDFDPSALVGWNYAIERSFLVTVTDGVLDITDPNLNGDSLLNAIEVFEAPSTYPGPAAISGFAVKPGYGENILTWDSLTDPNVREFRVDRATTPNGPWAILDTQFFGPPRYLDRSAAPGTQYFYRITAIDHGNQSGPIAGPIASTAVDTGASTLPVYELTVDPEDLTKLSEEPFESDEVPATFTHNGVSYPVEIRYRGSGSRRASKKSWKVKFDPPTLFQGRKEFNLKANFSDSSLIREQSIRRMHKFANLTAAEHQPIHLQINGVFRGVFDHIEQIDEDFLEARGRSDGDIYKAEQDFRPLVPNTEAQAELKYNKKTNEGTGNQNLRDLIEMVNDPSTTLPDLADKFDLDSYLNYLAIVSFLSDNDQLVHNYFLLNDIDLDRWEWITWDNDSSFANENLALDWGTCPTSTCSTNWNRLRDLVYENDALRWRLVKKIEVLMASEANTTVLGAEINQRFAEVQADAVKDIFKGGWERDVPFLNGPANHLDFINDRTTFLATALPAIRPPMAPTEVWINEFMAINETTLQDGAAEFDDWIELYNRTNLPVSIGGMYLTDDIGDPTQWQIPAGTTIPAFGELIIWADDDGSQGPLHANFKLSGGGEEIALFAADGTTLLDFYHYRPQVPDVSEGRITNGAQWFSAMPNPTPGAANTTSGNLPPRITFVQSTTCTPDSSQSVELTCLVQDEDPNPIVRLLYSVNGGSFTALNMSNLDGNRYGASIPPQSGGSTVEYYIEALDTQLLAQTSPFDAPNDLLSYSIISTNPGILYINEVCADNDSIITNLAGDNEDYLELYNASASAFDLSDTFLTDDVCEPDQWQFPAGTTIAPGGTLLVWSGADNADPTELNTNFGLSKGGESVGLYEISGGAITRLDVLEFGPQESDVPSGLLPNGGANVYRLLDPTPGASNLPGNGDTYRFEDRDESNPIELAVQGSLKINTNAIFAVDGTEPNAQGFVGFGAATGYLVLSNGVGLLNFGQARRAGYITDNNGDGTAMFSIPNASSLVGVTLYAQAITANEGWSNAVAWTIDM